MGDDNVEKKDIESKEPALPDEHSRYDNLVQDVVTRRYQQKRGDPPGKSVRAWVSRAEEGSGAELSIHTMGDPDAVQELGEALEKDYTYHGHSPQPMRKEVEADMVGGELGELYKETHKKSPHVLPRFHDAIKHDALKEVAAEAGKDLDTLKEVAAKAGRDLDDALEGFEPKYGKEGSKSEEPKRRESEVKDKSTKEGM